MKKFLSTVLISGGIALGAFQANAKVDDVGVVGPNGEVLLYYQVGNLITIKACEAYSVLGMNIEEARKNCVGKTNELPEEVFRRFVEGVVAGAKASSLSPLTEEEVVAYRYGARDLSEEDVKALEIELDKIDQFSSSYGEGNADLKRRDEIRLNLSAYNKVNTEVKKVMELVKDGSKLTITKFDEDKNEFLYTVLKNLNPRLRYSCGLTGSIDERIENCSMQESSLKGGFVLVTRTKSFREIYKDLKSGFLWIDYPKHLSQDKAESVCNETTDAASAGISGVKWKLPTREDYMKAEESGIKKLPGMDDWYWTSSKRITGKGTRRSPLVTSGYAFNGRNGYIESFEPKYTNGVMCLGIIE